MGQSFAKVRFQPLYSRENLSLYAKQSTPEMGLFFLYTKYNMVSLQDLPKKVQYIIVDSEFVNGTNNTFTIDLSLESNLHVEEISEVIGIKPVDFYITQVGENDLGNTNVAKYIDIVCDDIPKRGQILNERNGQILARVPLERSFTGSNDFIMRDKQWRSFQRQTNLFNPISIQKLNFRNHFFCNGKLRTVNCRG